MSPAGTPLAEPKKMELLKQGDFVIVYDSTYDHLVRGIVITDEFAGQQIYVAVVLNGMVNQNYYTRKFVIKVS